MAQEATVKIKKSDMPKEQVEGVCFTGPYSLVRGRKNRRCKVENCRAKTRLYCSLKARVDRHPDPVWLELKVAICKQHKHELGVEFPPNGTEPAEVHDQ